MFKNETHNHPTEIEPFGGAATCLGGAIRDRCRRSYVPRNAGHGQRRPARTVADTMPGKLPQRKICLKRRTAIRPTAIRSALPPDWWTRSYHRLQSQAHGNRRGGGRGPAENVVRKAAAGRRHTAAGRRDRPRRMRRRHRLLKAHDVSSIDTCGAEVQKGDPLTERKLQRLFRNRDFASRVKLQRLRRGRRVRRHRRTADGVRVNLDLVRKNTKACPAWSSPYPKARSAWRW